jgi:hypothetical protein
VTTYVLEAYVPRPGLRRLCDLNRAAAALERPGRPVRLVRAIYLPCDETCFLLVETTELSAAEEVGRELELAVLRIAEAVTIAGTCRG